jgi:hypothetical protein
MIRSVCGCENAKEKKKFLSNKRTEQKRKKKRKEMKFNAIRRNQNLNCQTDHKTALTDETQYLGDETNFNET